VSRFDLHDMTDALGGIRTARHRQY